MSLAKKLIILSGILIIVLMVLYPPYTIKYKIAGEEIERYIGYGSFFSPPNSQELYEVILPKPGIRKDREWYYYKIHIDSYRLGLQIFLVVVIVSGIFIVTIKS